MAYPGNRRNIVHPHDVSLMTYGQSCTYPACSVLHETYTWACIGLLNPRWAATEACPFATGQYTVLKSTRWDSRVC